MLGGGGTSSSSVSVTVPNRTGGSRPRLTSTRTISDGPGQTSQVKVAGGPSCRIGGPEAQASSSSLEGADPPIPAPELDECDAERRRLAACDRERQSMRAIGVRHLQSHGRPGKARGVEARVEPGAGLGPGMHDPAARPIAAQRLDQGLRRHSPRRLTQLGGRRTTRCQQSMRAQSRQIERIDLGFARVSLAGRPARHHRPRLRIDHCKRHPPHRRARNRRRLAAPDQSGARDACAGALN